MSEDYEPAWQVSMVPKHDRMRVLSSTKARKAHEQKHHTTFWLCIACHMDSHECSCDEPYLQIAYESSCERCTADVQRM